MVPARGRVKRLCLFGGFWDSKKAPKRHQKGIILLVYCLVFSTLSYFKKVYSFLVFSTLVFLVFLVSSAIVSRVPELGRFLVLQYSSSQFFISLISFFSTLVSQFLVLPVPSFLVLQFLVLLVLQLAFQYSSFLVFSTTGSQFLVLQFPSFQYYQFLVFQ